MKARHDKNNKSVFVVRRSNSSSCFLCFKPLDDPVTVADKVLFYHPATNHMDKHLSEKRRQIDSLDEKGSRRKGLSRAVEAVLFHTKLSRRNRDSKIGSESMRRDSSSCSSRFTKRNHDFDSKIGLTKSSSTRSTPSSISCSSSSCLWSQTSEPSTPISSSIPNLKHPKQGSLNEQSSGSIIMGFLLILISLTLTIFWGKLWAIALNAIWLYFIPQHGSSGKGEKSVGVKEVEKTESSREQRRRVIMKGLLDRKHYHHHRTWQQRQQQD